MKTLELTLKEEKELEKRAFIIKSILLNKDYFVTLYSHLSFYSVCSFILLPIIGILFIILAEKNPSIYDYIINNVFTLSGIILLTVYLILFLYITYKFTVYKSIFISKEWVIANNERFNSIEGIPMGIIDKSRAINKFGGKIIALLKIWKTKYPSSTNNNINAGSALIFTFLVSFVFFIIAGIFFLLGKIVVWIISPFFLLVRFSEYAKKIQSLTPQIEEKSKLIQKNFKKDSTDFHILHEGFDSLSSTFSEIVSHVIKLERVEKRANKGNLFDSEKYINSLRSDIVEPLKSLKIFLERQKIELLDSQKELERVRVRVGGGDPETIHETSSVQDSGGQSNGGLEHDELTSESALSSKRSESLMSELTENIGKLDQMIGRMS